MLKQKIIQLAQSENNPDISKLTQKAIEKGIIETILSNPEEEIRLALEKTADPKTLEKLETIKHYIGYAGEHLVIAELLLSGINAMRPNVDDGWDIIAINKNQKTFFIQVKTAHRNKYDRYSFHLNENNFSDSKENENRIFVFVFLIKKEKYFAIMNGKNVEKELKKGNIWKTSSTKRLKFSFYLRKRKLYLGNLDNNANKFLNNWKVFKMKSNTKKTTETLA